MVGRQLEAVGFQNEPILIQGQLALNLTPWRTDGGDLWVLVRQLLKKRVRHHKRQIFLRLFIS